MTDISSMLKEVYAADAVALGARWRHLRDGGRRAPVRARRSHVLVVRNGWFSFRWSQILDAGGFAGE
jgi:hypothetical protein